jgi:hypothetical protein
VIAKRNLDGHDPGSRGIDGPQAKNSAVKSVSPNVDLRSKDANRESVTNGCLGTRLQNASNFNTVEQPRFGEKSTRGSTTR